VFGGLLVLGPEIHAELPGRIHVVLIRQRVGY